MRFAITLNRLETGYEVAISEEAISALGAFVGDLIRKAPAWWAAERDREPRDTPRFMRPAFQNMTSTVFQCACGIAVDTGQFHAMTDRCGGPP